MFFQPYSDRELRLLELGQFLRSRNPDIDEFEIPPGPELEHFCTLLNEPGLVTDLCSRDGFQHLTIASIATVRHTLSLKVGDTRKYGEKP